MRFDKGKLFFNETEIIIFWIMHEGRVSLILLQR